MSFLEAPPLAAPFSSLEIQSTPLSLRPSYYTHTHLHTHTQTHTHTNAHTHTLSLSLSLFLRLSFSPCSSNAAVYMSRCFPLFAFLLSCPSLFPHCYFLLLLVSLVFALLHILLFFLLLNYMTLYSFPPPCLILPSNLLNITHRVLDRGDISLCMIGQCYS